MRELETPPLRNHHTDNSSMINQWMLKLVGKSEEKNTYLYGFKVFPLKTLNYKKKKATSLWRFLW